MAAAPTGGELEAVNRWASAALAEAATAPFSFGYGEGRAPAILSSWRFERSEDAGGKSVLKWTDPATGLECRAEITRYSDFPAVEWVLYFKNTGTADTPILDGIQALDAGLPLPRDKSACVYHARGSECRLDDFMPLRTPLGPDARDPQGAWIGEGNPFRIESKGGRSSCGALPFFNVDLGAHGVIGAVGWTGDWAASFHRTDAELRMRAGMRRTHLKLLPGEEIRSPRILLLFWEGERMRGHNLLRQFILAHHTPLANGRPAQAPISHCTWGGNFADKHIAHGRFWKEHGLPMEYLWVDAGWFGRDEAKEGANVFNSQWARYVGDWRANPGYFPQGLKPVSDALKQMDLRFLLWLEPERVFKDTPWTREHPEWLLGPLGDNRLYDLGNPDARKFLADFLSNLIEEGGLGCYRQDFNMDPAPFWEAADAPDRVGMAEIGHITGLYALWDDLRARHPGLLIDNCSSGGRRIDLETISRSIPLWRSDVQCFPGFGMTAMQGQTHGLGLWVPLSTGCCDREDTYAFRSALGPGMVLAMIDFENDADKHFSVDWLRARLGELTAVREHFLGDFYPLLSYSLSDDVWAAWQFDRPDLAEGTVLALRRPESPFAVMAPKLQGLDPNAGYEFRDADTGETRRVSGKELMETGFRVEIAEQPGSKLYTYKKAS
jgi:alpha-galactosidase